MQKASTDSINLKRDHTLMKRQIAGQEEGYKTDKKAKKAKEEEEEKEMVPWLLGRTPEQFRALLTVSSEDQKEAILNSLALREKIDEVLWELDEKFFYVGRLYDTVVQVVTWSPSAATSELQNWLLESKAHELNHDHNWQAGFTSVKEIERLQQTGEAVHPWVQILLEQSHDFDAIERTHLTIVASLSDVIKEIEAHEDPLDELMEYFNWGELDSTFKSIINF